MRGGGRDGCGHENLLPQLGPGRVPLGGGRTTSATAASTSSPVRVRSSDRKVRRADVALLAGRQLVAAVLVGERHAARKRSPPAAPAASASVAHGVASSSTKFRSRSTVGNCGGGLTCGTNSHSAFQRGEVELAQRDRPAEVPRVRRERLLVALAQPAPQRSPPRRSSAARPRGERGEIAGLGGQFGTVTPSFGHQQRFQHALGGRRSPTRTPARAGAVRRRGRPGSAAR